MSEIQYYKNIGFECHLLDDKLSIFNVYNQKEHIGELYSKPSPYYLENVHMIVGSKVKDNDPSLMKLVYACAVDYFHTMHTDWQLPLSDKELALYTQLEGIRTPTKRVIKRIEIPLKSKVKKLSNKYDKVELDLRSKDYFNVVNIQDMCVSHGSEWRDVSNSLFAARHTPFHPAQKKMLNFLSGTNKQKSTPPIGKNSWASLLRQGLVKQSDKNPVGYDLTPLGWYFTEST